MNRIKLKSSIERVYIGDGDNDYIELNFNDSTLPSRFYAMVEKIQSSITEKEKDYEDIGEESSVHEIVSAFGKMQRPIGEEIDAFFGDGTCMKLWGCSNPRCIVCMDFLQKIFPFFEEYINDFNNTMNKYTPERTGNV